MKRISGGKRSKHTPPATYVTVSYLMLALVVFFDYITTPEFIFSLFYLIPISYNTWHTNRIHGFVISILSVACWLFVDLTSAFPYQNYMAPYWNSSIRFVFFMVVVYLLSKMKYLTINLEGIVNKRTSELTEQIRKKNEVEDELTRSRNLYQDLVENINEVYYTTDIQGNFKYISPNFYKTVGVNKNAVTHFLFNNIIHPEDRKRIRQIFEKAFEEKRLQVTCDFRIQFPNKQTHWFEQNSRVLLDKNDFPYEIRSLLRDVTERKAAEISLLKSEMKFQKLFSDGTETTGPSEAEYLANMIQTTPTVMMKSLAERVDEVSEKIRNRVKQAIGFSSLASHELRTPLAIIRNLLEENLRADITLDTIRETTASIYDEVLRLQRIIADLLKISTMEAGKFVLHREVVQMDEFLQSFYDEVQLLSQDKDITVKLTSVEKIKCNIDKAYFLQMLFNIFDNALKYTPHSGEINIICNIVGNEAEIIIKDNGLGMSPAALTNLFKDFYQSNPENSIRGTGLGLILSKWIAELHNGSINIESLLDHGTTVIIRIPVITSPKALHQFSNQTPFLK